MTKIRSLRKTRKNGKRGVTKRTETDLDLLGTISSVRRRVSRLAAIAPFNDFSLEAGSARMQNFKRSIAAACQMSFGVLCYRIRYFSRNSIEFRNFGGVSTGGDQRSSVRAGSRLRPAMWTWCHRGGPGNPPPPMKW